MKGFTPAAIALLVLIGSARAIDVPVMKEGLWKLHMVTSTPGEKPTEANYFLCRDHAYDLHAKTIADNAMKSCTSLSDTTSGGKRSISMTCSAGGSKITSKAVMTSTGDTYFHTETSSTFSPPLGGEAASNMVQEQTWVGPCPGGMSPGDRKMSDGSIQRHR